MKLHHMGINSYQKIIKDGLLIQSGDMDTPLKFQQLTEGVILENKTVLDVGCNLGMMCNLATEQGATTKGIDINRDFVKQAKHMFPELDFQCGIAEEISGNYDIIIATGMLHYVDIDKVFKVFARCGKQVLCDIWLHDSAVPIFALTHRNIYVPSESAFLNIAHKYFNVIEKKGATTSPDQSKRYIFHLSDPILCPAEAVVIYGEGKIGKTTLAGTYFGYSHIAMDAIFGTWKTTNLPMMLSVAWFASLARGKFELEYVDFFVNTLQAQLKQYVNRDIVVEGYDLKFDDLRSRVLELLSSWKVTEIANYDWRE